MDVPELHPGQRVKVTTTEDGTVTYVAEAGMLMKTDNREMWVSFTNRQIAIEVLPPTDGVE